MITEGLVQLSGGKAPQDNGKDVFSSRKVNAGAGVIDLNEMIRQSKGA